MNAAKKEARVCDIEGCQRKHKAQGLCEMHYTRLRRHGDTAVRQKLRGETVAVRLAAYSRPAADGSGCLLWIGERSHDGYGRIKLDGKTQREHRVAWADAHGPIPDGKHCDHVCNNPACVSVGHLQLVTNEQNQLLQRLRSGGFASKATEVAAFIRLTVFEGLKVFPTDGMSLEQAAAAAAADRAQGTEEAA